MRPASLGQAARIDGMTPAAIAVLMVLPMLSSMSDPFASMFQAMNTLVQ